MSPDRVVPGPFDRLDPEEPGRHAGAAGYLRRLRARDLTALGVAAIVGAGIFVVLGGVASDITGPAIVVSILIAGAISVLTALVYAEFAGMLHGSGSHYQYTNVSLGRLPAFLVGWSILAAYLVGNMAVAVGWSVFLRTALAQGGLALPAAFSTPIEAGGIINVPAAAIMLVVTAMTVPQIRSSARLNNVLVAFKLLVVVLVIILGLSLVRPANWQPFAPYGGTGILRGAALMVFAYLGYDTICAAGAEARDPRRDLPRGILVSLGLVALLYVGMGAVVTGMQPITQLGPNEDALAALYAAPGLGWAAGVVSLGALAAMTTVMFAFHLALARVLQSMASDGLLPAWTARVSKRTGTPVTVTIVTGLLTAAGAAFLPLQLVAAITVVSNFFIAIVVGIGLLALRRSHPELKRPFRAPTLVVVLAILATAALAVTGIEAVELALFVGWLGFGMVVYALRARVLRKRVRDGHPEPGLEVPVAAAVVLQQDAERRD